MATNQETTGQHDEAHGADHAGNAGNGHEAHAHHEGQASHSGHGGHGDHAAVFRRLFWLMLILAIPTVGTNAMFAEILGYQLPDASWLTWVSPIVGTVIYLWGGWPFLSGAWSEITTRKPGMMLLIGMAISVAFVASWGASLGLLDHKLDFWWELALLVVIMLLGHWMEMRSLARTGSALDSLAALLPDEAERVTDSGSETVSPSALEVGDVVIVRPGGSVPADGTVVEGRASMDESMITGESKTVGRGEGDRVVAGTIATDSGIRVKVAAVGEDTALAGISRLVADAQSSSSRAQRLADRAAAFLFWFALTAAVITAVVWGLVGSPSDAVIRAVTVLVIACPHALGLAIPLVVSIATERAARVGVLVKDRLALEAMRLVDVVVFDKTGTLTRGEPRLEDIDPADGWDADELLALAAAAETDSEHPLARAIVHAAKEHGLAIEEVSDFTSSPAVGVTATVAGRRVRVGGPALLEEEDGTQRAVAERWRDEGAIILHLTLDGEVAGAFKLADEIRDESRDAVAALQAGGIDVVMITGDAAGVANHVGGQLGIDRVFAGVRPEEKEERVKALQGEGRKVAMVGDGVNDAPALARADVGIAIGAGTDVAIGSAGVILATSDPRAVVSVLELSRATYKKMKQNLWWAVGYNAIAVPLAAGVLAPVGFVLPVSVGALLMSASTIVVALNAQLLRRADLSPEHATATLLASNGSAGRS